MQPRTKKTINIKLKYTKIVKAQTNSKCAEVNKNILLSDI